VRAGGKHNDLENVGYTARHHTFFEMLGNFSFGDYFKREAIRFAWEFLTGRTWACRRSALGHGAHSRRRGGADLDRGDRFPEGAHLAPGRGQLLADGRHRPLRPLLGNLLRPRPGGTRRPARQPDDDLDRYIEIWNLVFMQYNRDADGEMTPLPKPSVDTGMGLERIAAVLQGVHSNYEIDLFQALINGAGPTHRLTEDRRRRPCG
jgi:alanyl-tRNA synthetase